MEACYPHMPPTARSGCACENRLVITRDSIADGLLAAVPEAGDTVREHLDDQEGQLLLHLLMPELLRFGVAAFEDGETDQARRLLEFVGRCLADGDEYVRNAVQVSFVENYEYGQNEPDSFVPLWPDGLRAELGRSL